MRDGFFVESSVLFSLILIGRGWYPVFGNQSVSYTLRLRLIGWGHLESQASWKVRMSLASKQVTNSELICVNCKCHACPMVFLVGFSQDQRPSRVAIGGIDLDLFAKGKAETHASGCPAAFKLPLSQFSLSCLCCLMSQGTTKLWRLYPLGSEARSLQLHKHADQFRPLYMM